MIWMFAGETLISKFQKIFYRTLHIVHETFEKSYEDLLLMNYISIHQNHLHFLVTENFKSVNNLNFQIMWNYFSFKPVLYELRKGNAMHFSPARSTWHGINNFLFSRSLLGNNLPREIKEKFLNPSLKKRFLHPHCVDKYQRCIQNPVGFNSFKSLAISGRSYFLEDWCLSTPLNTTIWIDITGIFLLVGIC